MHFEFSGTAEDVEPCFEFLGDDFLLVIVGNVGLVSVGKEQRKGIIAESMSLNKLVRRSAGIKVEDIHAQQAAGSRFRRRELPAVESTVKNSGDQTVFVHP